MNVQEQLLNRKIDPHLSDEVLSTIASAALGSRAAVHGYQVLTGGCWNRVVGVHADGTELVIKISPHADDQKIVREFGVLTRFRELSDMPVPEPLLLDAGSKFTPGTLFVMTRVPGRVMHECFGMFGPEDRRRITTEIATHLAALHDIRAEGFGGVEIAESARAATWPEFWLPRFDRVIDDVDSSGVAPRSLIDAATEIRPHLEAPLRIGSRSTMTHYDVWSGNVMIDVDSGHPRVSGYIDIPGHFADYARELSFAMLFGVADRTFFEVYSQHHEIDPAFELRASIYNLKMNLRHIQMYPNEAYYQRGAAECLEIIMRHLGD